MVITTHNPPPVRLLDISRQIGRANKVSTGVDRVEIAYIHALLSDPIPVFAIVRTALGYVLLEESGIKSLLDRFEGRADWGGADPLSYLKISLNGAVKRAQSDARRFAFARCRPRHLSKMLKEHLPQKTAYINTGQTNITDRMMNALRYGLNAQITILIHDAIPLDFPQFQVPKSVGIFRSMIRRTRAWADLVIYNSHCTQRDVERHMQKWGPLPSGIVAHLGVKKMDPTPQNPPVRQNKHKPYFVIVSTLEPRKNHGFLLDIWDRMEKEAPKEDLPELYICGRRGWRSEELFKRLDARPDDSPIHEINNLDDGALAALVQGSAGLLFPSYVEGFGLPPVEAAMLGVPVVCGNLDIFHEILGKYPVYADLKDSYLWQRTIIKLAEQDRTDQKSGKQREITFEPPNWEDHFNIVLKAT